MKQVNKVPLKPLMVKSALMVKCKAKAKSTGKRCRRYAVSGYSVCQVHGAGSPRQGRPGGENKIMSAGGRHSKHLKIRLASGYEASRTNPNLLEHRDEVALLDTRLGELLDNLQDGDTRELWQELGKYWLDLEKATARQDKPKQGEALQSLGRTIKRGNVIYASWKEVYGVIEQRRKTVDSERKRLVEMQQTITAERAMILIGAILGVIQRNIKDKETINIIRAEFRELVPDDSG